MPNQDTLDPAVGDTQDPVVSTPTVNWKDTIPAEIKSHPIFEKYKEPGEAFKALVEAQKFLGREKLPVPKDANDKETYDLIFKTLGRPESPDGYQLPTDVQIPKDLPLNEEMIADFKKVAHENGVLPQQFAGIYTWYMNSVVNQYNKLAEKQVSDSQEAETTLRKEYGSAYKQKESLAQKVVQQFADDKAVQELSNIVNGKGNNPGLFKMLVKIGEVLSEDQLVGKPHGLTMTPEEAHNEINKIKGDMNHPYWNASHQLHNEAVEKMQQLIKMLIG